MKPHMGSIKFTPGMFRHACVEDSLCFHEASLVMAEMAVTAVLTVLNRHLPHPLFLNASDQQQPGVYAARAAPPGRRGCSGCRCRR